MVQHQEDYTVHLTAADHPLLQEWRQYSQGQIVTRDDHQEIILRLLDSEATRPEDISGNGDLLMTTTPVLVLLRTPLETEIPPVIQLEGDAAERMVELIEDVSRRRDT